MVIRKVLLAILAIAGIGLFALGVYIEQQVSEGREKIAQVRGGIQSTRDIISGTPLSNTAIAPASKQVIAPIESKVDEKEQEADHYADIAHFLKIGGGALFIVAIALYLFVLFRKV